MSRPTNGGSILKSRGPAPVGADARLLYVLAQAERAMHTRLDRDLEAIGISLIGYSVLRLLEEDPAVSASEIARRTLISQQAGSRLTTRLIKAGFLSAGKPEGRSVPLSMTQKGKKALQVADPVVAKWEARTRKFYGAAQSRALQDLLAKLPAIFV